MTIVVDLILDTGELVRIEAPNKFEDDIYTTLENAMKRGDWWTPGQFDGCSATLLGISMGRVSMKRVVGML